MNGFSLALTILCAPLARCSLILPVSTSSSRQLHTMNLQLIWTTLAQASPHAVARRSTRPAIMLAVTWRATVSARSLLCTGKRRRAGAQRTWQSRLKVSAACRRSPVRLQRGQVCRQHVPVRGSHVRLEGSIGWELRHAAQQVELRWRHGQLPGLTLRQCVAGRAPQKLAVLHAVNAGSARVGCGEAKVGGVCQEEERLEAALFGQRGDERQPWVQRSEPQLSLHCIQACCKGQFPIMHTLAQRAQLLLHACCREWRGGAAGLIGEQQAALLKRFTHARHPRRSKLPNR